MVLEVAWIGTQDGTIDTSNISVEHLSNKVLTIQDICIFAYLMVIRLRLQRIILIYFK